MFVIFVKVSDCCWGWLISLYQNDLISIGVVVRTFWFLIAVIVFWFLWYFLLTVGLLELLWEVFGCCQTIFIVSDCCLFVSLIVVLFCSVSECSICFRNFLIVGVIVRVFWLLSEFSVGFLWQKLQIATIGLLSEFSDCVLTKPFKKCFQTSKVRTKNVFFWKKCKKRFCGKKTSHNQNFLIVDFLNLFFFENVDTIRKFWQQSLIVDQQL